MSDNAVNTYDPPPISRADSRLTWGKHHPATEITPVAKNRRIKNGTDTSANAWSNLFTENSHAPNNFTSAVAVRNAHGLPHASSDQVDRKQSKPEGTRHTTY